MCLSQQWSKPRSISGQAGSARYSKNRRQTQSGQIIVEYILLLFISVTIATALTRQLIDRNPDSPGLITGAWNQMNQAIGSDIVD